MVFKKSGDIMRKLIILRGVMGSGKSSFIKEHNLEDYTLCADKIRLMLNSLEMTTEYCEKIPQFNNKKAWELLFMVLEERMKKGEFTIIDATHPNTEDLNAYKKLAEKYRYRLYVVDFTDISLEELYRRNEIREESKRVPKHSIDRIYKKIKKEHTPSSFKVVKPEEFDEIIFNHPKNCGNYNKVHVFGDIHGCYDCLKEYLDKNPIKDDELYIFLGDYFDKGLKNFETFRLLSELIKLDNTIFLLGNHDDKLYKYACDDEFKLDYDILGTINELEANNVKKSELRGFLKQLAQISYIKFGGQEYLINHGGIPYFPDEPLELYSTNSFVYGVDKYEVNIDSYYNEFMKNQDNKVYQIHGHRNFGKLDYDEYEYSFNLDGDVENGGCLRVLTLDKDGTISCTQIKNEVFNPTLVENEKVFNLVNELRGNKYIYEKVISESISSFNFSKEAFYQSVWNSMTTQARGLFIDIKNYNVVARSYNKFFNIEERKDTTLESLQKNLSYPVCFYLKYNGFLGILSVYDDELFFASKSNHDGPHVDYFKKIFESKYDDNQKSAIKDFMIRGGISLVFEVIEPREDPHIIKYENETIVLLDAIKNKIDYEKLSYDDLKLFANSNNIVVKELAYTAHNQEEFSQIYSEICDASYKYNGLEVEGFVIEDSVGSMFKVKTEYYKTWKLLRSRMEYAIKNNDYHVKAKSDLEKSFMEYLENKYKNTTVSIEDTNIIKERDDFYLKVGDKN